MPRLHVSLGLHAVIVRIGYVIAALLVGMYFAAHVDTDDFRVGIVVAIVALILDAHRLARIFIRKVSTVVEAFSEATREETEHAIERAAQRRRAELAVAVEQADRGTDDDVRVVKRPRRGVRHPGLVEPEPEL